MYVKWHLQAFAMLVIKKTCFYCIRSKKFYGKNSLQVKAIHFPLSFKTTVIPVKLLPTRICFPVFSEVQRGISWILNFTSSSSFPRAFSTNEVLPDLSHTSECSHWKISRKTTWGLLGVINVLGIIVESNCWL